MRKIDLLDTTFIIPYFRDSVEREENLDCILKFLDKNFKTKVIVVESGPVFSERPMHGHMYEWHHQNNDSGVFHRTKVINYGIKQATTPYISIYDTDVVFDFENIVKAVIGLRMGSTLVYPYSGAFVNISRHYISTGVKLEHPSYVKDSVGGACFLNKEDYKKCGYENENIISWGPEDSERYHRVKTLGYVVERIYGKCFHIEHPASSNSGVNKFTEHNNNEYMNITSLSKEDLIKEIATWTWNK